MLFSKFAMGLMVTTSAMAAPGFYPMIPGISSPMPGPGLGASVPLPFAVPAAPPPAQAVPTPEASIAPAPDASATPYASATPDASVATVPAPAPASPTSAVVPSPNPGNTDPAPASPTSAVVPSPNPGNTDPATPPAPADPQAGGQKCAADIDRLASGIQQNILNQQGETVSAQTLITFLQNQPGPNNTLNGNTTAGNGTPVPNISQFMTIKSQLLSFVTAGILVRQNNQALTPTGNPVVAGLGMVAAAQEQELSLSSALSGDPSLDMPMLNTLLKAFAGGTKQNMQNLLDATQGCVPTDIVAVRGVQVALRAGLRAVMVGATGDGM